MNRLTKQLLAEFLNLLASSPDKRQVVHPVRMRDIDRFADAFRLEHNGVREQGPIITQPFFEIGRIEVEFTPRLASQVDLRSVRQLVLQFTYTVCTIRFPTPFQ
ncbi:hypothetical protein D3C71_1694260 [compost metagenome]